jgi:hypothetical protein
VILWNPDLDHLEAEACRTANRNLTCEEWRSYIGAGKPYHKTCEAFPGPEKVQLTRTAARRAVPPVLREVTASVQARCATYSANARPATGVLRTRAAKFLPLPRAHEHGSLFL